MSLDGTSGRYTDNCLAIACLYSKVSPPPLFSYTDNSVALSGVTVKRNDAMVHVNLILVKRNFLDMENRSKKTATS